MAIENYPVWSFEPNWSSSVTEMLEWLTDIMASPDGSEQRRSLRFFPRRQFEFSATAEGDERQLLDNMLVSFGGTRWYLPLWHEVNVTERDGALSNWRLFGGDFVEDSSIRAGSIVFIAGDTAYDFEVNEVAEVLADGIRLANAPKRAWPAGTRVFPVTVAELTDQPQLRARTSNLVTAEIRFRVVEPQIDPGPTPVVAGPMIVDGLIVNAYHQETGRGGYFHHNSGTSEGQFIFIYGAFLAYEALRDKSAQERAAAGFYKNLAIEMCDAMGDGSYIGPMLRQPVPTNVNTITLVHWLFAARGDIPGQQIVYAYETGLDTNGNLRIPSNASGDSVFKVWAIYPGTSELLYESPFSPAYNIANPGAQTQIAIADNGWIINPEFGATVISIPPGAPNHTTWKIIYGYETEQVIPVGDGFEAYPNWTKIEPGYSACAPDTFRWFEQAMTKAMQHDTRPGMALKWDRLRLAMRRTAVKGQAISDLREVIQPMPGFDAIPTRGAPDGMYCYSDHPRAERPTVPGANSGWLGFNFWARAANGDLFGNVPAADTPSQVQIGRGFSDQWRTAQTYQQADQFLYVAVSASKKPVAANNELFLVYVSSTMAYDENTRWYADIGSLPEFVAGSTDVTEFFIPRTAFRLRVFGPNGTTTWGSVLPAGTIIENFGISSEMRSAYNIRLRAMRLVSGPSPQWVLDNKAEAVKGSKMPFFPGSLPFAINADLRRQQFVGWNGSPFHGYQLADHWWWLPEDANAVHPGLTVNDLPIPARNDGSLTYPITPLTAEGAPKPRNALLMEQQLIFLREAQARYRLDAGNVDNGFFAHTFVLNTPARASLGNPTPHTWVYVNDDPNTRWIGYQTRLVESLAELVKLTANNYPGFADARSNALVTVNAWLNALNVIWPNLNGKMVGGKRIYGMPTDFPDPRISPPQTLYEEPHAAAHVLRACLTLRVGGGNIPSLYNSIITRCWDYIESLWRTTGEMRFTWSPDPAARQWYGFWHGDILTMLAQMIEHEPVVTALGIDPLVVRQRLLQTQEWIEDYGIGGRRSNASANLSDVYRNFYVLAMEPEFSENVRFDYERNFVEVDNQRSIPERRDISRRPFTARRCEWMLEGRAEHHGFGQMLQVLRGRNQPVWVPTFADDFTLLSGIAGGALTFTVRRCGFTSSGGPRWDRDHIMIELIGGGRIYRQVTASSEGAGSETIVVDVPFEAGYAVENVLRISFMSLMRLNHDGIEIEHSTDNAGASTASLTFRSAPNTRRPISAFNE